MTSAVPRHWQSRSADCPTVSAADDGTVSQEALARSRGLASEESRLGNIDAAIRLYSEALELIRARSIKNKALYLNILELAIVYLRLGETQNCVGMHTSDSCILPIRGKGVYQNQESSRKAIELLEEYLGRFPRAYGARWLLNIANMTIREYPDGVPEQFLIPPDTFASDEPFPRFTDIAPELGLNAFDLAGGSAVDDFNVDGWLDIVCSASDPSGQIRYFEGNPDKTFTERTQEAGVVGLFGGLNMNHTDYNNDGFPDILVLRGAWLGRAGATPNSLLRNNGDGTFTDVTFDAGLAAVNYPTQTASWADYDNDGDLDLYVGEVQIADVQLRGRGAAGRSGQGGAEPPGRGRPRRHDPRLDLATDMGRIPAASPSGGGAVIQPLHYGTQRVRMRRPAVAGRTWRG